MGGKKGLKGRQGGREGGREGTYLEQAADRSVFREKVMMPPSADEQFEDGLTWRERGREGGREGRREGRREGGGDECEWWCRRQKAETREEA